MNEQAFVKFCKDLVRDYTNQHLDPTDGVTITTDEVFIVWTSRKHTSMHTRSSRTGACR